MKAGALGCVSLLIGRSYSVLSHQVCDWHAPRWGLLTLERTRCYNVLFLLSFSDRGFPLDLYPSPLVCVSSD